MLINSKKIQVTIPIVHRPNPKKKLNPKTSQSLQQSPVSVQKCSNLYQHDPKHIFKVKKMTKRLKTQFFPQQSCQVMLNAILGFKEKIKKLNDLSRFRRCQIIDSRISQTAKSCSIQLRKQQSQSNFSSKMSFLKQRKNIQDQVILPKIDKKNIFCCKQKNCLSQVVGQCTYYPLKKIKK